MGTYDASSGTWSNGATYKLSRSGNDFVVTGEIPYGEADSIFGTAGNRFAVRVYKDGITSRSDLPSGDIVKTTNTNATGGYNVGTKSDFETDGSLIAVFAPTSETLSAYDREIKIKWASGEDFTTYKFDLSRATLEEE